MNMPTASFQVAKIGNVIHAVKRGRWTIATDIEFINEVASVMQTMRGNPWALVVDMRDWIVSEDIKNYKHINEVHLDRRNQKLECWLIDFPGHAAHLERYIVGTTIPFKQFTDSAEAQEWLATFGFTMP